jgi:hypothetical protein
LLLLDQLYTWFAVWVKAICAILGCIKELRGGWQFTVATATTLVAFARRWNVSVSIPLGKAFLASGLKSVLLRGVAMKVFRRSGKFPPALRAAFHEVSPYWPYLSRCGKAVRLAFQNVDQTLLSHLSIIPHFDRVAV